jgi:DNA-binding transcriptional LysR family regulator
VIRISIPDWSHRSRFVAAAIADIEARDEKIVFEYSLVPWTVSDRALRSGDVDIGFHVAPSAAQFGDAITAIPWLPEPGLTALISSRHPLAGRSTVRLKDLQDTPTLIPSRDEAQALHDQMLAMIRSGGYEPRVVTSPLNFAAAAQLVAVGAGWIISAGSIAEMPPPGTAAIPLEDAKLPLHLYILHRADDRRASISALVDALHAVASRELAPTTP